jgi:3-deoxy-D-manno-octulosonic-acid transferase
MYFLYSLLTAAGMLLLSPYFAVQGLRKGKYWAGLRQRLGYLPREARGPSVGAPGAVWIHAVSVGEALAALPLARRLKERFPGRRLVISTTTATGQRVARERMDFADAIFYFPLDWAGPVRRVFRVIRPGIVVILETEIWPNFLRVARGQGVPVVFVNGRISERSFRRYRWVDGFLARVLADAEVFLMQSEEDARRLRALGAPGGRVGVMGNLKYDLAPPASSPLAEWLAAELERQKRRPLVIAGSVVAGEEEAVLGAFATIRGKWPRALLVLAPRKPERFEAAACVGAERGFSVVRRSVLRFDSPPGELGDVLLLDSIGELAAMYRLADAVFVGGSLVPAGGHNILEPACFGRPPVFGPSMHNFRDAAAQLLSAGAAVEVASGEELSRAWCRLLEDQTRREQMGRAARELVEQNRGATERALERIASILESHGDPA